MKRPTKKIAAWVFVGLLIAAAGTWGVLRALGPRVQTVRVAQREVVQTVVTPKDFR